MTNSKSSATPRPRILLIEDDTNLLNGLVHAHGSNFDITTVQKPIEAIELVEKDPNFAVIICDYQLPELTGDACLAQIQSIAPNTAQILLTGNRDMDTAIDSITRGAMFRILQKPCGVEDFARCVRDSVAHHELRSASCR